MKRSNLAFTGLLAAGLLIIIAYGVVSTIQSSRSDQSAGTSGGQPPHTQPPRPNIELDKTADDAGGSGNQYRSSQAAEDLRAALRDEVRNGASLEHVQQLLGPGREAVGEDQQRLVSIARQLAQRVKTYPEGIHDNDRFVGYPTTDDTTLYLQFRDDKLINFNHQDFAHVDALHIAP